MTPADAERGIERLIRPDLAGFSGYAASKSPETLRVATIGLAKVINLA